MYTILNPVGMSEINCQRDLSDYVRKEMNPSPLRAYRLCLHLKLETRCGEPASKSFIFVVPEAVRGRVNTCAGPQKIAGNGKEGYTAKVIVPFRRGDVISFLRIEQRIFETILLFVDKGTGSRIVYRMCQVRCG